jgi:hypothetical protein
VLPFQTTPQQTAHRLALNHGPEAALQLSTLPAQKHFNLNYVLLVIAITILKTMCTQPVAALFFALVNE